MPSDFVKVLVTLLQERRPDIDLRQFTAVFDLLLQPHALLQEPLKLDIDNIRNAQSLLSSLSTEDLDLLVANVYVSRRGGELATGIARVFLESAIPVNLASNVLFIADNGTQFRPTAAFSYPASLVRLNQDGSLFYVDVPVTAVDKGAASRIDAHSLSTLQGSALSFVKVDNPFPFTGGVDEETNTELVTRAADAITVRDLVSGRGVRTQLTANFAFIERIFVAGFLDPEQNRDVFEGIHIGGQGDVYIKPVSLLAEQVKIFTPNILGDFSLSNGLGAIGDTRRPVVLIDAVRPLGPGPAFTPGAPLNRQESILVDVKPLVTQGEYLQPSVALNTTLNQFVVVAIERVSPTERYVVASKLDLQGETLVPFTRIAPMSAVSSVPYVTVNPANNRAYVFWGEGGVLDCKILDVSGSTFTTMKDTFAVVTGSDEIMGRADSTIGADNNIHLVFTRKVFDVGTNTYQDNPWYARLDSGGNVPGLVVPRQLTFNFVGQNNEPSITLHGTGAASVITAVWSSKLTDSSNIYALQLDNAGQFIGSPTPNPLTVGFGRNDEPTIRVGPSDSIHMVWNFNRISISYMRLLKTGLAISIPQVESLVRPSPIREVRMITNVYGQLYAYWSEFAGDFDDIFTAKLNTEGVRIGDVHDVTITPYFSSHPTLLTDNSASAAVHLIWVDGGRGLDKPFYTKRSPQEWHLNVADKRLRYSVKELLSVTVEVPAAAGIAMDIQWSNLLPAVQQFCDSPLERTIVSNLLVRNQIPVTVSCDIKFGPRNGTLSENAAQTAVEEFIAAFTGGTLEVSSLVSLLFSKGATTVVLPFEVRAEVDQEDGTILTLKSEDELVLPRGTFLTPSGVTVTYK